MAETVLSFRVPAEVKQKVDLIAEAIPASASDVVRAAIDRFLRLPIDEQRSVLQGNLDQKKADGWAHLADQWLSSDSYSGQVEFLRSLKDGLKLGQFRIPARHRLFAQVVQLEYKVREHRLQNLVAMADRALELADPAAMSWTLDSIKKAGEIGPDHALSDLVERLEAKLRENA